MDRTRIAWMALAGAALIALLFILLDGGMGGAESTAAGEAPPPLAAGTVAAEPAEAAAAPPASPSRSEAVLEPAASAAAAPAAPERPPLFFSGRCVAAESGAPLAGCRVKFHGWPGNENLLARYGQPDWKDLEPVVTGPDGVFRFEVPETLPYQFALYCEADGRLGRSDRYDTELPGGATYELGDIPLELGARVAGIVRDEHGGPVEKIRVSIRNLPMEIRPGQGAGDSTGALSDAAGVLAFRDAVPAGTWPVSMSARGYTLVGPDSVTVEPGLAPVTLELRVRGAPTIEGTVLDESGQPVAGALVETVRHSGGRIESSRTDPEGLFRIFRQRDLESPVQLNVEEGGVEPMRTAETYPWGARGVILRSRRLLSRTILVRERGSGAPVEEFAVKCHPRDANSSKQTDARLGGSHPGGRLVVTDVAYGENWLQVLPSDPALLPNPPLTFQAPEPDDEPLVVELERMEPLSFSILSASGAPIAGSTVGLSDGEPREGYELRFLDPRRGFGDLQMHGAIRLATLWSLARTDAAGAAELFAPAGVEQVFVVVEGEHPRHVEAIERPFAKPAPLVVRIGQGATIRGVLLHPAVASGKVGVLAVSEVRRAFGGDAIVPDAAGAFEIPGLTAGTWKVMFCIHNEFRDRGSATLGWQELEPPLAELQLAADEVRELRLDATSFAFASLRARAEPPGAAGGGADVSLMLLADDESARMRGAFGLFVTDARHEFQAPDLPPGRYRARLAWKDAEGISRSTSSINTLDLRPGEQGSGEFRFARLRLRLRLLDSSGAPLAGVGVQRGWFGDEVAPRTDADGWVELGWMDPGPADLRLLCEPARGIPRVEVDSAQELTVIEARALTREELQAERQREAGGG